MHIMKVDTEEFDKFCWKMSELVYWCTLGRNSSLALHLLTRIKYVWACLEFWCYGSKNSLFWKKQQDILCKENNSGEIGI